MNTQLVMIIIDIFISINKNNAYFYILLQRWMCANARQNVVKKLGLLWKRLSKLFLKGLEDTHSR